MKKLISLTLTVLLLVGMLAAGCNSEPVASEPSAEATTQPTDPPPTDPEPVTLTLGDRVELLVDDYLFQSADNITLGRETPVDRGVAYEFDMESDGEWATYFSVLENPQTGEYWMYYHSNGDGPNFAEYNTCLAISKDGFHFEPAVLENGTNRVKAGMASHNFAPFYDTNPNCKPGEEFKAVGDCITYGEFGEKQYSLQCYHSPDGIHWEPYFNGFIRNGTFDTLNTVFWDSTHQEYRCYARYFHQLDEDTRLRAIRHYSSQDFLNWEEPIANTYNGNDTPEYALYTNSTRSVPGAEHIYVAIPMRINDSRKKVEEHYEMGVSDCVMITSRDGIDWFLPDGKPWIYPDIDERQWTDRNFITSAGFFEIDDEFVFYVQKHYRWDTNRLHCYTVPKFRLGYAYSLDGTITTKPFILESDCLNFNYKTSAVGTLRVTVLDEKGTELQTCEIYGNELEYELDMTGLKGKVLQLVIDLEDAYLYAISG